MWIHRFAVLFVLVIIPMWSFAQDDKNWIDLFNGKDLSGWTVKCKSEDSDVQFWKADNGTILADSLNQKGHDYVWLMTEKEYSNFILRLRFQAYKESPGNSGVQIRSRYDEDDDGGWLNGPQIDIHPPGPWRCGMMWDETRGNQRWIFPKIPKGTWVDPDMSIPKRVFYYHDQNSGWNDLEITARGMDISARLNDVMITQFNGNGILNDTVHKEKNVGEKGHIVLQIHKGDQLKIRFKDIRIRVFD